MDRSHGKALCSGAIACSMLCSLAVSGFAWPGYAERLVSALTAAKTPREKRDALRLLAELEEPFDLAPVERALRDSEAEVRADALRVLARAERDASALVAALDDGAPAVRIAAVQALAPRATPATVAPLFRALNDSEPAVRLASARALGPIQERAVVDALVLALDDGAIEVRCEAARALGQQRDQAALTALLRRADDPLPELRAAVVGALAAHADGRAALALERALGDDDELVLLAALRGFAGARAPAPQAPLRALASAQSPAVAEAARRLLDRASDRAPGGAPAGRTGLALQKPGTAVETAPTAPRPPRWLPPLERTAEPALTPTEAAATLDALERALPDGELLAADPLLEWLPRAPAAVRPRIMRLLERTRAPLPTAKLLPWLDDAQPAARAAAARLFAQADGETPARLRALLADRSLEVRIAAVFALMGRVDRANVRALTAQLDEARASDRDPILQVLARSLPRVAPALDRDERAAVRKALVRELEGGSEVRAAWAASALGAIEDADARAALRHAAATCALPVRIAALRAGVLDHSPDAQALRRDAIDHAHPGLAATAIVAQALAGDPLPWPWLFEQVQGARWPRGPAAAFAIAHGLRAHAGDARDPCALRASGEPATRSNVIAIAATLPALGCVDERAPTWLAGSASWTVRYAAARWAASRASDVRARDALARCAEREREPRVRAVCAGARRGPEARSGKKDEPAPAASRAAMPSRGQSRADPRALVLEDGRVLISWPDASGEIAWPGIAPIAEVSAWLGAYERE